nr:MAG TPA: hypothetical protein [Caudoviricetes sp.]
MKSYPGGAYLVLVTVLVTGLVKGVRQMDTSAGAGA